MRSRPARASSNCAFAKTSAALRSGLTSSTSSSPARTLCPRVTAKRAKRPLISGATLISVLWTTPGDRCATTPEPTIKNNKIPTAPKSAATAAIVCLCWPALRGIGQPRRYSPPRRHQCETEIGCRKQPQVKPIGTDLAERGSHLIDADQTVDRGFGRKDASNLLEDRRDHLARPGNADKEELRQGGRDENQDGRLAMPEQEAGSLAHQARRENKG